MQINKKVYLNIAEVHEMVAQTLGISIDKFKIESIVPIAVGAPGQFTLEIEIKEVKPN